MALTFIDTNKLARVQTAEGEACEVLNQHLAGAKNVVVTLRWLNTGEKYAAQPSDKHQLLYLMEGTGSITLADKSYDVKKGAGVYLGPTETATIEAAPGASLKLFHIVTPQIPK